MDAAFLTNVAVYAAALPLGAAAGVFALGWLRRPRSVGVDPPGSEPAWAGAAVPVAVAAFWPLAGTGWAWPPGSGEQWIPWVALAAGVAAAVRPAPDQGLRGFGAMAVIVVEAVVFAAIAVYLSLRARLGQVGLAGEWPTVLLWVGLGAAALVSLTALGRQRGWMPPLLLIGVLAAAAGTWALTGHIRAPLAAMTMGAALGGAVLIAWRRPALRLAGGACGAGVVLAMLFSQTVVLGDTPAWCNVLLVVSLVAAAMTGAISDGKGATGNLLRVAIVALPAAGAVAVAALNQPPELEPYDAETRSGELAAGGASAGTHRPLAH